MSVEGINLQGSNQRQVVVQADNANLAQRVPQRDAPLHQTPIMQQMALVTEQKNAATTGNAFVVQKQEPDLAKMERDPDQQFHRRPSKQNLHKAEDIVEGEESLDAKEDSSLFPQEWNAASLNPILLRISVSRAWEIFQDVDRRQVLGLLDPEQFGGRTVQPKGMRIYSHQKVLTGTALETFLRCLDFVILWSKADVAEANPQFLEVRQERLHRVLSVAIQTCRSSHPLGNAIRIALEQMLEHSIRERSLESETLLLLEFLHSSFSDWRKGVLDNRFEA